MKIYTKTGDQGTTGLYGGRRLPKNHLRIESYGTVDELNAFVGLLRDSLTQEELRDELYIMQNILFNVGSNLASDPSKDLPLPEIKAAYATSLEEAMDRMNESLAPLKNFILPGGHPNVSYCHLARCVCRRAERLIVALSQEEKLDQNILIYFNRLSDYFFVLGRYVAKELGIEENIWKGV